MVCRGDVILILVSLLGIKRYDIVIEVKAYSVLELLVSEDVFVIEVEFPLTIL